jgi:hypothetical protein
MTPPRHSPRSTRDVIRQREAEQRELIAALQDSVEPIQHDLAGRLHRCQQAREARRRWHDCSAIMSGSSPQRCRLFSCSTCRRSIIRHWQNKARWQFAGAYNDNCSTAHITLARTSQVSAIRHIVLKARKDFGNLRTSMNRQQGGWRWQSLRVLGMVKPKLTVTNVTALPAPDQPVLQSAFLTTSSGTDLWQPCVHLLVHHPLLDRMELVRRTMRQWPGAGCVNIVPFSPLRSAVDNAADIVGNSLERFEPSVSDETDAIWPLHRRAEWHTWLFSQRRGLQPLVISSQPRSMISLPCSVDVDAAEEESVVWGGWRSGDMEPMPIVF